MRYNAVTPSFTVADAAYPLRKNKCLTPFRDNGHLTELQKRFNVLQSSLRMVVERAFGLLRKKWKVLQDIQFLDSTMRAYVILVCCILHNILLTAEDDDVFEETNVDAEAKFIDTEEQYGENLDDDKTWREAMIDKMFMN